MEWAARQLISAYFESHEEAMGYHVECSHLAMTLPGMKVSIKAKLSEIRDRKLVCDVEAFNSRGKLARGTVTQAVIEKSWLTKKVNELALINQLSSQAEAASKTK
jgi:fluoroacetyl-CoA thioesterase